MNEATKTHVRKVLSRPYTYKAHVYKQLLKLRTVGHSMLVDVGDKDVQLFRVYLNKFSNDVGGRYYSRVLTEGLKVTRVA